MLGRVHEHRPRPDRGVRKRPAEEQVRRCFYSRKQRALHLDAEEKSLTGEVPFHSPDDRVPTFSTPQTHGRLLWPLLNKCKN